jgi:hypothetical protein
MATRSAAAIPKFPRARLRLQPRLVLPEDGFNVSEGAWSAASARAWSSSERSAASSTAHLPARSSSSATDIYTAADDVPRLLEFNPIGPRGIDDRLIEDMKARS